MATPKTAVESDARQIRRLRVLMDRKEALEAQVKEVNKHIFEVKSGLRTSFETQRVKSLALEGVGTCGSRDMIYAKVVDADATRAWLAELGREEIIKEDFNKSRLAALVKEQLKAGEAVPECVSYIETTEISLRRS